MWELNSVYRVRFFLNLIFTKYFCSNTPNVFFNYAFITRQPQRQRHDSVGGQGWGSLHAASSWETPGYICRVSVLSCRCLLDTHVDRQLLKSVKLKELLTEHLVCLIPLELQSRSVWKKVHKGCFLLLPSVSWEDLVASQNMQRQAVPNSVHSELLLTSALRLYACNYFLSK